MDTLYTGHNLIRLQRVDSTNNYAAKLIQANKWADGTVIVAEEQLAGRGRNRKDWLSEPGKNLTCSFMFKVFSLPAKHAFVLNAAASLAVCDALLKFAPALNVRIKWPNDVFIDDQKVAGLLIESQIRGAFVESAIVGIGLNVNQTAFEFPRAGSIALATGQACDKDVLLTLLCSALEQNMLRLKSSPQHLMSRYNEFLYALRSERRFMIRGEEVAARLLSVRNDGMARFDIRGSVYSCELDDVVWRW